MAKVIVSNVCGLCAGSYNAINKTRELLSKKQNVVLFKEILHNQNVIKELEKQGVKIKNSLTELNKNDFVIIRAHGEPKATYDYFEKNDIEFLDLTCGNVKAINILVNRKMLEGYKIILIGKKNHPEVQGTSGWCENPIIIEDESDIENLDLTFTKYFLAIQTTFNKEKAERFLEKIKSKMYDNNKIFEFKNTICSAQKNINISSKELAELVDVMIVIGGKNSSNTKELYNAMNKIKPSYHIENEEDLYELINQNKLSSNQTIGLTAGASTMPEDIEKIKEIIIKI